MSECPSGLAVIGLSRRVMQCIEATTNLAQRTTHERTCGAHIHCQTYKVFHHKTQQIIQE